MWRFKGCPRCKGDMLVNQDHNDWYEWCLQCGYRHDLIDIMEVRLQDEVGKGIAEKVPLRFKA